MNFKLCGAACAIMLLVYGCVSPRVSNDNPFITPDRGYGSELTPEQKAKLTEQMQPCVDTAKETFPKSTNRFFNNPVKDAQLYVVTRSEGPVKQFYVLVEAFDGKTIQGRMNSNVYVHGKNFNRGDTYSFPVSEMVDWLIYYQDRPEEGNLLGKYLLRRKDGLITGDCDPTSTELTSFRVYRKGYSFIPPDVKNWRVYGANNSLGTDFTMQKSNSETGALDTIYTMRSKLPQALNQKSFVEYLKSVEEENLGDPNRYQLSTHEVTSIPHGKDQCVLSKQLIKDNSALLKSGERKPMLREVRSIVCIYPYNKSIAVTLTHAHRYSEGARDPDFDEVSEKMFRSLSFF